MGKIIFLHLAFILSIIYFQTASSQKSSSTTSGGYSSISQSSTKPLSSTKAPSTMKDSSTKYSTKSHSSTKAPSTKFPSSTKSSSISSMSSSSPSSTKVPLTKAIKPATKASSTMSPVNQWSDPYVGGKAGNPGAEIHLSNKTIDVIHAFVSDSMAKLIQHLSYPDLSVANGSATLIIKTPHITESRFADFSHVQMSPNRIRSIFYNGKIVANGNWEYKSANTKRLFGGRSMTGVYKATINNGTLDVTNQLGRTSDAKPIVQVIDCKTNFSRFRVDIEGAGSVSTIENCDDLVCRKIRTYFEDAVCPLYRKYVKDYVNVKLATFPALNETYSKNQKINYGLQSNEPKFGEYGLDAGLEGRYVWFGGQGVPFNPQQLDFVNRNRMYTFELSDYAFNTLLHQTHAQNYRFSANELLANKSQAIKDQLILNCSSSASPKTITTTRKPWGGGISSGVSVSGSRCMGLMLENMTTLDSQRPYGSNETGDFVYKSNQRAPSVIVQAQDRSHSFFDASNGTLELYGPAPKRQLLGKVDVKVLRGEFYPKLNGQNITGSIKINSLELYQSPTQKPSFGDLSKLKQFAQPLLVEMFNVFFDRYGQFPIPILDDLNCAAPDFLITNRSMQVDCDIKSVLDSDKPPKGSKPTKAGKPKSTPKP